MTGISIEILTGGLNEDQKEHGPNMNIEKKGGEGGWRGGVANSAMSAVSIWKAENEKRMRRRELLLAYGR